MSETYNEQDQVEALKAWWKEYGTAIIIGVVSGALLISGYRYWNYYKTTQSEKASAAYEQIKDDIAKGNLANAEKSVQLLIKDYSISPYPAISSLVLADKFVENKDFAKAKEYLSRAVDSANDKAMAHVARLRLARILFYQENKADEALALISNKDTDGFSSHYAELKGDIYFSTGNITEAVKSYTLALSGNSPSGDYRTVLQMKLDNARSRSL